MARNQLFRKYPYLAFNPVIVLDEDPGSQFLVYPRKESSGSLYAVLVSLPGKRLACRITPNRDEKELRSVQRA